MSVTLDKIEAIAPDQPSLAAALKIKGSAWGLLAQSAQGFAWGECQGSGSTPYRVALSVSDLGYKCTCPSRKFPCKHSLGLMLQLAKAPQSFSQGEVPDWVNDWSSKRRGPNANAPVVEKPKASLEAATKNEPEPEDDPQAEARAAKQRERLKAQREASILSGLDEFDLWISDVIGRGISVFIADASSTCRIAAQRLVDAKAPALAAKVDALPSQLLALPLGLRAEAAIEALGSWHLLAQAYRRQEDLPPALRHDVRRLAGWNEQRQALLDDASLMRHTDIWTVIATHSEVQPDKLRRIETWLTAVNSQVALLLDFVPVATGAGGSPFVAGEQFQGELVFYPSAVPLRALMVSQSPGAAPDRTVARDSSIASARDEYDDRRNRQPWLGAWPLSFSAQDVRSGDKGALFVCDATDALPLDMRQRDELLVLQDVALSSATGFWDGRQLSLVSAQTSLGPWMAMGTRP